MTNQRTERKRGRPAQPAVTWDELMDAALRYIEANGLANFSVRELGRALGVYPTALHWKAGKRDEILAHVVRHVLRELDAPPPDLPWAQWIVVLGKSFRELVHRYPATAPLLTTHLVANVAPDYAIVERFVAKLEEAGFRDQGLLDAYNVVLFTIFGFVAVELGPTPDGHASQWATAVRDGIEGLDRDSFPHLVAHRALLADRALIFRWSTGSEKPMDVAFDAVLAGVVVALERSLSGECPLSKLAR